MEIREFRDDGLSTFIYQPNFFSSEESNEIKKWLDLMDDFKNNMNYNENKIIRKQKWYQTEQKYFCPEWIYKYDRWVSFEYDNKLYEIQKKIQSFINNLILNKGLEISTPLLNSCLINKFRDGNDRIRPHRDTDKSFGEFPTIIGLSIGGERNIKFERTEPVVKKNFNIKKNKNKENDFQQKLENGSLYIMSGYSQKHFTHEIPPSNNTDIRYSLTFRQFNG